METNSNERETFWGNLNECLAGFDEDERLIVLGDLNAEVGDKERWSVGKHGVPGINENGEVWLKFVLGEMW